MVYQIFSDAIDRRLSLGLAARAKQRQPQQRHHKPKPAAHLNPKSRQFYANLLIVLIKFLLIVYDVLSLPVYFALQRPDRRVQQTRRPKARQLDANTWIGLGQQAFESEQQDARLGRRRHRRARFVGATVSEMFSNAVKEFNSQPCLGYRALVTCPIITLDENGQHVFKEQSFRSDFTWYTYGQVGRRVQDLASGLYANSVFPSTRAMFMASSCLEWFCMAHACFQLAVQLVLWPESGSDLKTLHSVVMEAQVETLFVSCDQLAKVCLYLNYAHTDPDSTFSTCLKRIVIIDWQFAVDFDEPLFLELARALKQCGKLASVRPTVLSIGQVEEAGIEKPIELLCSRALGDENLNSQISLDCQQSSANGKRLEAEPSNGHSKSKKASLAPAGEHAPDSRLRSCWMIGDEPISPAPCMSAPTSRKQLSSRRIIDGAHSQLQATLLNSYRDPNHSSPALAASRLTDAKPQDLALIVYTFGSLGQLKAIMLTHSQLARSSHELFLDGMIGAGDTHCAVLPLDCTIELMSELCIFSQGGSIGYSNNLKTLFHDGKELFARDKSDLETANPTYLLLRPYILEQLRASLQSYLQLQLNPLVSFVFRNVLFDYKSFWTKRHFETPLVDRLFCARLKRFFGSQMRFILCNGTTDCSETKDFFAFMVGLPVVELYGPDEAVATMLSSIDRSHHEANRKAPSEFEEDLVVEQGQQQQQQQTCKSADDGDDQELDKRDFCDTPLRPPEGGETVYRENLSRNILISSSIFCPTSGTRIRLEDWAEFRLDDSPYPRGRLVIGGDTVCKGYLDQCDLLAPSEEDRSRPFFRDSLGVNWFRTGDIARAFPDGSFEIISAISNIIKMADGQFVSLSQIEHILRNNQFVDNVCALCGRDGSFVVNLVVPNLRRIALKSPNEANLKMAIGMEPEPDELIDIEFRREVCNDRLLCEFVTDHLKKLLSKSGLSSIRNRFLLVPEIWTPESELVTAAFEPRREAIEKFYANDIQSLVRINARKGSRRLSDNRRHKPRHWAR